VVFVTTAFEGSGTFILVTTLFHSRSFCGMWRKCMLVLKQDIFMLWFCNKHLPSSCIVNFLWQSLFATFQNSLIFQIL
jgi:hypothetical protein